MRLPRTYLFVPGNRPERFDKALASGADAIVIDLEDAVAPDDKASAREHIARWSRERHAASATGSTQVLVRINDASTPWFERDLECVREARAGAAMLPKAESPAQIARVRAALSDDALVLPIIESARGILQVAAIAEAPGVVRLAFGTLDYAVDLAAPDDERNLAYPSAQIAIASRAAGIASPVAGVTTAIDDESQLLSDLEFARAFGFGAKLCIHPKQVAPIHRALAPSAEEVDWAQRVLAAAAASSGAARLDGRMIDRPVLLKARSILDRIE